MYMYMCPTSSSLLGAMKEKRLFFLLLLFHACREYEKVTDCNEFENSAEFYIFIWGTVPGGDEDNWAIKFGMQIQR
jgi:hypothetical protein